MKERPPFPLRPLLLAPIGVVVFVGSAWYQGRSFDTRTIVLVSVGILLYVIAQRAFVHLVRPSFEVTPTHLIIKHCRYRGPLTPPDAQLDGPWKAATAPVIEIPLPQIEDVTREGNRTLIQIRDARFIDPLQGRDLIAIPVTRQFSDYLKGRAQRARRRA